ncbi:MAG: rod shape-determining protein RodA [bacterium]
MSLDRRQIRLIDPSVPLLMLALTAIGLVVIRGGTASLTHLEHYTMRQVAWFAVAAAVFVAALIPNYNLLEKFAPLLYWVMIALLVGLLIRDYAIKGATSWYRIGALRLQPSEFAKIATVFYLARIIADKSNGLARWSDLWKPIGVALLPFLLIAKQPDLGTAAVFVVALGVMLWIGGARRRHLLILLVGLIATGAAAYPFLKPYQKSRIQVFLNPGADPLNKGYNLAQSQIALGSGQAFGKGWGNGTQTAFQFLPEHHTDFIFASLGEQFGFVGCATVLLLFGVLFARTALLSLRSKDAFGGYLIIGLLSLTVTHVLFNAGMAMGLLPVTGLPLPFISYGGSFLVATYLNFSLILNVDMQRYYF